MLISKKGVMYIKPEGLPEDILSITTTKFSGFSKGDYASLNFGYHVGDDILDVDRNYDKIKKVFKLNNILTLNQIHSGRIVSEDCFGGSADGIYTDKPNIALGIMTADCFNVQLIGKNIIANLHCGWKSIYAGIIENCLKIFDQNKVFVDYAVIGPGICEKCYEVSEDLISKFYDVLSMGNFYNSLGSKFYMNLRKIINFKLVNYSKNVIHLNYCTKCCDFLYSHRRNSKTGRLISVLMRYG